MLSIRWKLLLPLVVAGAGAIAYLGLVWSPQTLEAQRLQNIAEISHHLDTVAEVMTPLVLTGQLDVIHEDLNQLRRKNPQWKSVRLINSQGKQLYPPLFVGDEAGDSPPSPANGAHIETDLDYLGRPLGKLLVEIDLAPWLELTGGKHRQLLFLLIAIIAGIALITGLALELAVRWPVRRLSLAAEALSRRHFDAVLPPDSGDEVGQLVGSFAAMRQDLQAYQEELLGEIRERRRAEQQLVEQQQHLEQMVLERTSDLQAAEAHSRLILESSAAGLYGVGLDGCFTFINGAACAMLGYRPEELSGRSVHATIHHSHPDGSPYPAHACPMLDAASIGSVVKNGRETFWRADGSCFPIAYGCQPMLSEGRIVGAVVSFTDITAQVAAEVEQEKARQAAERLSRLKSEFLANMSHEIRTPLNGVLGMAQIGLRHSNDPARAEDAFTKISNSGKLLLGIVNDILDFSKIEAGKMAIECAPVDLGKVLTSVLELIDERARAKGLPIKVRKSPDFPMACQSDSLRIGQILLNLLSNAVKFTEKGSITLAAELAERELVFRVSDTGIGISAEEQEHIFAPFEQADGSTTRKYGGTGLGLTITQRIVELMGGSLRVESQPGAGSTFEVRLPYVESRSSPSEAARQTPGDAAPLAGLAILVVEDNEINQAVLVENLVSLGARVTTASNGQQAVACVKASGPAAYDIVLMDIQMPVMNGYEAARHLRQLAPKLPIIGQTAHALAEEKEACLAAGMVAHLAKPIDFAELQRLILSHVSGKPGL